jgi:hypothetical protein
MGIRCKTTSSEVGAYFDNRVAQLRQVLLNNLIYVGESAVREARENHRYKDQTGNLTSSIGYCVLDNGSVVKSSSFERVKNGTDGSAKGREFLNSLISEHSSGLVLIIVAGMQYAAYVEAKNLNVLDSAEQLAERLLPQLFKALQG